MTDKKSDGGKLKVKVKVTVPVPSVKQPKTMSDRMKGTLKKLGK